MFTDYQLCYRFHTFFNHIDHYKTDYFLWATASGIDAAKQSNAFLRTDAPTDDEDEPDAKGQEG